MTTLLRSAVTAITFSILAVGCVQYSGVAKADNQVYLSGGTTYLFITIPFIKRCDVEGSTLHCEELKEYEAPPPNRRGGAGTEEKPADKPGEKPADKPADKPGDKPADAKKPPTK